MSLLSSAASTATGTVKQLSKAAVALASAGIKTTESLLSRSRSAVNEASPTSSAAASPEPDRVIDLTGVDPDHAPFAAYETLSGDTVMRHVRDTDDVAELRQILAFERAHKARKGVLQALDSRLAELV